MKIILGGSMARVGALSECPFQGDESIHNAGNTVLPSPNPHSFGLLVCGVSGPVKPNLSSLTS